MLERYLLLIAIFASDLLRQWLQPTDKSSMVTALWKYAHSSIDKATSSVSQEPPLPSSQEPLAHHSSQDLTDCVPRNFSLKVVNTQPTILISPSLKAFPSFKHSQNSCWIDISFEAIFWLFNYNWAEISAVFEPKEAKKHHFHPVYALIKARRLLLLGNGTEIPAQLQVLRQEARRYILTHNLAYESAQGSFNSVFVRSYNLL